MREAKPLCVLGLCRLAALLLCSLAPLQIGGKSGCLFSFFRSRRKETSDLAWQDIRVG